MSYDFFALLKDDASWVKCARCCREIAKANADGVCFDCQREAAAKADLLLAERDALATIPQRFQWVHGAHAQLADILGAPSTQWVGKRVKQLLAEPLPFVTITGQKGAGKTCLAVAMMRAQLGGAFYIAAHQLAVSVSQHGLGQGDPYPMSRALSAPLLVLDELRDPGSAPAKVALERVLWERYDANLRTIITTGLTRAQVVSLFGEGAERRLFDEAVLVPLGDAKRKGAAA